MLHAHRHYGVGASMMGVQAAMHTPCAALQAAAAPVVVDPSETSHAHQPTGPVTAAVTVVTPNTSPALL